MGKIIFAGKAGEMANAQRQAVKNMTALLFDDISNTIPPCKYK